MPIQFIYELTGIDPWFLHQIKQIVELEQRIGSAGTDLSETLLKKAKSWGFSDVQLAHLTGSTEQAIEHTRKTYDIRPVLQAGHCIGA